LAIEQRWYPATALGDILHIEEGKINDTRLYRCLDRILPQKTKLEQHLKQRYGELFGAEFEVMLPDQHVRRGRCQGEPNDAAWLLAGSPAGLPATGIGIDCECGRLSFEL
jgi:hypothetical protein